MTRHILVIDDEEAINIIVKTALELTAGWQVTTTTSAETGLAIASTLCPDAILLDVNMPKIDGPSVYKSLQQDQLTQTIPVIFLTAKARTTEQQALRELGVNGLIIKPFNPEIIASQITSLLDWQQ